MMIRDILVSLSVGRPRDVAGEFALSAAALLDAHLSAVAVAYEPVIGAMAFPATDTSFLEAFRKENAMAADRARGSFEEAARRAGVRADSLTVASTAGGAAERLAEMARTCDLAILPQAQPDGDASESLAIEAVLFGAGRPVLVVPYIQTSGLSLERVLVCWDGSRNAARAVADALPLLRRSGMVEVVTIEERERGNTLAGVKIAEHLARHGVRAELNPIVGAGSDIAATILSHAADTSADLVVMGGYGHSRLREWVLGGATRGMLAAMTVPTLMAH